MLSVVANIILGVLVLVLLLLLYLRQKQIARLSPIRDLESVLKELHQNVMASRVDGNVQRIASQLSQILVKYLETDRILFFRKQRRLLEMNYVYGMKNLRRTKFRVKVSATLNKTLTDASLVSHPGDLAGKLAPDLETLLNEERFNLVFPVYWMDSLFGVYFIRTRLEVSDPLVQMFLMFLNQNLSAAYHIKRLESSRQILEKRFKAGSLPSRPPEIAVNRDQSLADLLSTRKVEQILPRILAEARDDLKAASVLFLGTPDGSPEKDGECGAPETDREIFTLDSDTFTTIFGELKQGRVYSLDTFPVKDLAEPIKNRISGLSVTHMTPFSPRRNAPGVLLWSASRGSSEVPGSSLSRLEVISQHAFENARAFQRMEQMLYTDGLTGLYNYRYFRKRLTEEIQRAKRYDRTLGLLLFDIDDFKIFNDTYGHQWGDDLLRQMGRTLSRSLRSIDIVSRYGGDEFCIIMPEADRSTCEVFMDRLRQAIAGTEFNTAKQDFEGRVTISVGAAVYPEHAVTGRELIYCADMGLLRSKAMGRNRCTLFSPEIMEKS